MSEEKAVYQVKGSEDKNIYDEMNSMDEIIKYYGIDGNKGCFKDFKNPAISNAIDNFIRVVNSYERDPEKQHDYRLSKMKNALHSLVTADEKLNE